MENASKALLMAGGILIAIIVLALIIMMINNIGMFQTSNDKIEAEKQLSEFNMEFEAYNREDVLGMDLVNLCNKINDYNVRYNQEQGYTKIESNAINIVNLERKNNSNKITSEFKGTTFKCTQVKYDSEGRIWYLKFEKINK